MNHTCLTGRLARDPELKTTPNGVSVVSFTVAVNRRYTNAQGERQADFINCVAFKKTAEAISNYLHKGSLIGVEGSIQTRSYENKEGRKVFVTEILCEHVDFLEPKKNSMQQTQQPMQQQAQQSNTQMNQEPNPFANANGPMDINDDLPF